MKCEVCGDESDARRCKDCFYDWEDTPLDTVRHVLEVLAKIERDIKENEK